MTALASVPVKNDPSIFWQDFSERERFSYGQKELDEDINLYYFNARFYDATTGRFINVDPVQDGTNWYVYCSNNPLSMVDPTGLEKKEIAFTQYKGVNVTFTDPVKYAMNVIDIVTSFFNDDKPEPFIDLEPSSFTFSFGTYEEHSADGNETGFYSSAGF